MDKISNTPFHADETMQKLITSIYSQVRDAIENGDVLPKMLYAGPGVSSTTVGRIMDRHQPAPSDMHLSTLYHMIDRMPPLQQMALISTLLSEWPVKVIPSQAPDMDLNHDGCIDAADARAAATQVNQSVADIVSHAVASVEDGHVDEDERAMQQRLRTVIQNQADVLIEIITNIASQHVRRQARPSSSTPDPRKCPRERASYGIGTVIEHTNEKAAQHRKRRLVCEEASRRP